jgi:hypothetical protein
VQALGTLQLKCLGTEQQSAGIGHFTIRALYNYQGKSPVDPYSGHIRLNTLCNVLTTVAVLENSVYINIHHHLMDRNWSCQQITIAIINSNVNNIYGAVSAR